MKRVLAVCAFALVVASPALAQRQPAVARPENYKLTFTPDLDKATFAGDETISIRVLQPTSDKEKEMVTLSVEKPLAGGSATIHIKYNGILNSEMRGLYLGKDDQGRKYAASQFEATDARRAYPSFDEPDYKATFDVTAV